MAENPKKVVIDTNVLVSAIVYGGNPRKILSQLSAREISAVTSAILLAELTDVLAKKFNFNRDDILLIERQIKRHFILVYPQKTVDVLPDNNPDNRVLEVASEGDCDYIITGDKELLRLKFWNSIEILTASEFYEKLYMEKNN
ncbi:MAG: putative toxin-antitoxin system toxin component, PIN family [Candidatus Doudnabacteria bacterium]|nr:putative toxin-antitoxin system toxin component, PIN family [Candidatus Doudnabacteria bacterium]